MTHTLAPLWLAGHQGYPNALGADGFPLSNRLGPPCPPLCVAPSRGKRDAVSVLGPGRTTQEPVLFLAQVRFRPSPAACIQQHPRQVDHRHLYWPPPLACVSLQKEDTAPWKVALQPGPEGILDAPLQRHYHPMDASGTGRLRPQEAANRRASLSARLYQQAPKDKCYYALCVRAYTFVRYDQDSASDGAKPPPAKVPRRQRRQKKSGGGGGVRQESRRRKRKPVGKRAPAEQRKATLKEQTKLMAAMGGRMEAAGRLLSWQDGGVSLDGKEFEFGRGFPRGAVGPAHVPDPSGAGARRQLVFGVPARTLVDLGLFPHQTTQVIEILCQQFGLHWLPPQRALERGDHSFSRTHLKTVLFPPIDSAAWEVRVRKLVSETKADALRHNRDQQQDASYGRAPPEVWEAFSDEAHLEADLAQVTNRSGDRKRGAHMAYGWHNRIVPVFMLPFILAQPAMYASYESREDPYFACLHMAHGLRLLSNAERVSSFERAAAWHDMRLLIFAMSLVWKCSIQEIHQSCEMRFAAIERRMEENDRLTCGLSLMLQHLYRKLGIPLPTSDDFVIPSGSDGGDDDGGGSDDAATDESCAGQLQGA